MNIRMLFAISALALVAGCKGSASGPPALSQRDAFQRLASANFAEFLERQQCGILIHLEPEKHPDSSIKWRVTSSGRLMFSFTVTLTPVDAKHTKATVAVSKEPNGHEAYDGSEDSSNPRPAVYSPVRPAIEEQVAAILEGRPFDYRRLPGWNQDLGSNSQCGVQRGGLESGIKFRVDDMPGYDSEESARRRADEEWEARHRSGTRRSDHASGSQFTPDRPFVTPSLPDSSVKPYDSPGLGYGR